MLIQDAGEIPIGLYITDKPLMWWLPVLLVMIVLIAAAEVVLMLQGDFGNGGPGDDGGGGRGSIPDPPPGSGPLESRIQFKQVIHARVAGVMIGTDARSAYIGRKVVRGNEV